jgi:hypothetical protein
MSNPVGSARTPESGSRSRTRWLPVPPKLVEDGARRMAWIAPVSAGLIVAVPAGYYYLQVDLGPIFRDPVNRLLLLATAFLGFGIFALHRYDAVSYTVQRALSR